MILNINFHICYCYFFY